MAERLEAGRNVDRTLEQSLTAHILSTSKVRERDRWVGEGRGRGRRGGGGRETGELAENTEHSLRPHLLNFSKHSTNWKQSI